MELEVKIIRIPEHEDHQIMVNIACGVVRFLNSVNTPECVGRVRHIEVWLNHHTRAVAANDDPILIKGYAHRSLMACKDAMDRYLGDMLMDEKISLPHFIKSQLDFIQKITESGTE